MFARVMESAMQQKMIRTWSKVSRGVTGTLGTLPGDQTIEDKGLSLVPRQ